MMTISSVVLSMDSSPLKVKTAERRQEFPGIPNEKGYCAFVTLRGLAASYQSEVIAGDTWQSGDLWQCSRPFQSRFPLPARGVPEYRRIKDILGHLKSAVAWAIEPISQARLCRR